MFRSYHLFENHITIIDGLLWVHDVVSLQLSFTAQGREREFLEFDYSGALRTEGSNGKREMSYNIGTSAHTESVKQI